MFLDLRPNSVSDIFSRLGLPSPQTLQTLPALHLGATVQYMSKKILTSINM